MSNLDLKSLEKLEAEFDGEMRFRPLLPTAAWIVAGLLFTLSLFHYYTAGFGLLREQTHRGLHLAFVMGLIFLVFPLTKSGFKEPKSSILAPFGLPLYDWVLAIAACVSALYVAYIYDDLAFIVGNPRTIDVFMGSVMIVLLLEASRRSMGKALPLIVIGFLLYALFGRSLPNAISHAGTTWSGLVNHLYLTSQGVFGVALGVVATFVFHYVLFGVLATRVGLGKLFMDLATAVAGRYAGGPAKVSILGSALFGMISGSSIANTVTVGSLTIPTMMRIGYPKHMAAGIEAAASTGGQITPPILGAAAFLMVEFLNLPYQMIVIAAIVPAFMHFLGVFSQVHFEAKKNGFRGLEPHEMPDVKAVLKNDWPASIPLFVLLIVLFSGFTPYLAAFWGITACLVVGFTNRSPIVAVGLFALIIIAMLMGWLSSGIITIVMLVALSLVVAGFLLKDPAAKFKIADLSDAFVLGAKYAIAVGAAAGAVGMIIGVVTLTGVGFKISNIVVSFANDMSLYITQLFPEGFINARGLALFFTLFMTALVCILLGCGVPTTATYIIMVTVAAPALTLMGVEPIVAHFFVFYFGVIADITPPVALAAYAAASMAGADPFKTGNTAFRLGLSKALVPFAFVAAPALLLVTKGFTWEAFIPAFIGCCVGVVMLATALTGYFIAKMVFWQRLFAGMAGLMLMSPFPLTYLIAAALIAPVILMQIKDYKNEQLRLPK